jgi:hypothetical protein
VSNSSNLIFDLKKRKFLESSKPITWDNIHWWGGYKKFHIPSAPEAFHAAHLHWRWGLNLQEKPKRVDTDPAFSILFKICYVIFNIETISNNIT